MADASLFTVITGLRQLKQLTIDVPGFTDKELMSLVCLHRLEFLSLGDKARVTEAGLAKFQDALPSCELDYDIDLIGK